MNCGSSVGATPPGSIRLPTGGTPTIQKQSPTPKKWGWGECHRNKRRGCHFQRRWVRYGFRISRFGVVEELWKKGEAHLDFDTGRNSPRIRPMLAVCRILALRIKCIRLDKTRRGWHVVIYHNGNYTPTETLAFELCCDSDQRRATLDLRRIVAIREKKISGHFRNRFSILFSKKLRVPRNFEGYWKEA